MDKIRRGRRGTRGGDDRRRRRRSVEADVVEGDRRQEVRRWEGTEGEDGDGL